MALLSKQELKDVFMGLATLYVVKNGISSFASINPDFDMPVTVDSLSMTQDAPTLNHYKVHGLQSDWAVSATPGDFNFSAIVPSVHKSLVNYFMGESNEIATSTINSVAYEGVSATMNSVKLNMGLVLVSEDGVHAIVVKKMAVYATPNYENGSTTPFAFTLTGSIEVEDSVEGGSSDDQIAFLKKKAS